MKRGLALAALVCAPSGCGMTLDLGSNDAGVPYDADCRPGLYTGSYSCTTTSGSPFELSGNGPIGIMLVPNGAHTLVVAPDASLASMNSGTEATSALTGMLDCSTRVLTGTEDSVVFTSPDFKGSVTGGGTFAAVYDADASTPALIKGVLNPPASLATMCTWTAVLQ